LDYYTAGIADMFYGGTQTSRALSARF